MDSFVHLCAELLDEVQRVKENQRYIVDEFKNGVLDRAKGLLEDPYYHDAFDTIDYIIDMEWDKAYERMD